MPTLHLLGTGAAVSDGTRTTTMLAIEDRDSSFLIDCGGDVIQRAQANGIDPATIEALFLTHEHADHVSGFPLLMERLWLSQRSEPLPVYGPAAALDQARRCFDTFDTSSWDDLFELEWKEIPLEEGTPVLTDDSWSIEASPGDHGDIDVIGLRFTCSTTDTTAAYSADTQPTSSITRLARDADLLVHEATGHPNHSTPEEAARIAEDAGVDRLVLVHLPPNVSDDHLDDARDHFHGPMIYGKDGDRHMF